MDELKPLTKKQEKELLESSAFVSAAHAQLSCQYFMLADEEAEKFSEWTKTLPKANCGAIGGRFTWSFCNTSLGTVKKVTDGITKQELDLTDYDSW